MCVCVCACARTRTNVYVRVCECVLSNGNFVIHLIKKSYINIVIAVDHMRFSITPLRPAVYSSSVHRLLFTVYNFERKSCTIPGNMTTNAFSGQLSVRIIHTHTQTIIMCTLYSSEFALRSYTSRCFIFGFTIPNVPWREKVVYLKSLIYTHSAGFVFDLFLS